MDVEQYLELARKRGLTIKYVVQTHIHEDFASGACALAAATGSAEVCVSGHDAPEYGFSHRAVHDGDVLELGAVRLTVKHTPGHTPEHISLLVAKTATKDAPFAVLSGGSLLVETAGRTDLLGPERVEELTSAQFRTLYEFFQGLDAGVLLYPTHVHGSPCGAAIGDKLCSTIGYEFEHNDLLRQSTEAKFREMALKNLPPKPRYYPRLKDMNTSSPAAAAGKLIAPALPPAEFRKAVSDPANVLVDTRHMLAFGGGHIPGALNIGAGGPLSIQAGWMLEPDRPLLLVIESDAQLPTVLHHFARTGFNLFAGYLVGGMSAWENAGYELESLPQLMSKRWPNRMHKQMRCPSLMFGRRKNGPKATSLARDTSSCRTCLVNSKRWTRPRRWLCTATVATVHPSEPACCSRMVSRCRTFPEAGKRGNPVVFPRRLPMPEMRIASLPGDSSAP